MASFFYSLVILPLESVIETLFYFAFDKFSLFHYGGAVLFVSLAVNLLTLPVYNRADSLRSELLAKEKFLARGVRHIRRTFSGDERFLLLGEYYAQNRYSVFSPLLSSLPILLQVPFFIAAYHFLSSCTDLAGERFLCIADLGAPDGLLSLGRLHLNLLPMLMTLSNILSGAVYSKGSPLREKMQIYVLALLFLLLLYRSPSGLVLYWLANNLFGLCRNLAQKRLHRPSAAIFVLLDLLAAVAALYTFFIKNHTAFSKKLVVYALCLLLFCLPLLLRRLHGFWERHGESVARLERPVFRPLFLRAAACLALLAGFALPSSMVATSPEDFSFLGTSSSPLPLVAFCLVLSAGLFVLWPSCFYFISGVRGRALFAAVFSALALSSLLDAFLFRSRYGFVNVNGVLDTMEGLRGVHPVLLAAPLLALGGIALLWAALCRKEKLAVLSSLLTVCCIGLLLLGAVRCARIQARYGEYARTQQAAGKGSGSGEEEGGVLTLTRTGKNVIVVFLDKAIGSFVPYAVQDFPELRSRYEGFVYYPNTLSFADHTVKGLPALYGGYEYTPDEMNRRSGELLKDKHTEALLALPRLFSEAGWRVTVTDPDWPDYKAGNLEPFARYPGITARNIQGRMTGRYIREHREDSFASGGDGAGENARNAVVRFCLLQMLYPPLRKVYYHDGDYYHRFRGNPDYINFLNNYSNLYYLDALTAVDFGPDSYVVFANETTHDSMLLQEDGAEGFRPVNRLLSPSPGLSLSYRWHDDDSFYDLQLYEMNCAALLRLGDWFDFLKKEGVYDNSRIIIVSDHGAPVIRPFAPGFSPRRDYSGYAALLLYKDFGAGGELSEDRGFMTNADVPLLSIAGLPLPDANPFTGKVFSCDKAGGVNVYVRNDDTDAADLRRKRRFSLSPNGSYHVHDDIFVESNWIPLADWERRQEGGD